VQSAALLGGQGPVTGEVIPKQIGFNCVPQIDVFLENGYTARRDEKWCGRPARILADPAIRVNATAVRVPVFFGHFAGGTPGNPR